MSDSTASTEPAQPAGTVHHRSTVNEPELRWTKAPDDPRGVVLVLHGGREAGSRATRWGQLAVVRMIPFANAVAAAGSDDLAVVRLRYAIRGWNGPTQSPLADARWALEEIRRRYPGRPIGLLGHSMGGRVALHLADEPDVRALVGLAPWVGRSDSARGRPGLRALLMHGTRDRMTDPGATERMAEAMSRLGADVTWRPVPGERHAMLRRASFWHRESARFLRAALLGS